MSKAKLLWVTDPWVTLDHPKDTTLRLIEESVALGIESHWCDVKSIRLEGHEVRLTSTQVKGVFPGRTSQAFRLAAPKNASPGDFTRILYRTDPPIDLAYLHPLQMLVMGLRQSRSRKTEIVNAPEALFTSNEKLEGSLLGDLAPPTCASSQWEVLQAFGKAEGRTVLKPLYEAQSKGVELLSWSSSSEIEVARAALEKSTRGFTQPVLLQRYLEGIHEGEQRLWFLNGKLLAFVRKMPKSGEFKIDMDQGGTVSLTELNAAEKKAARKISKLLRDQKIRMAAVDLIEAQVTDFNHTSPGLLTQIEALTGKNLAREIVQSLARPWR